MLVGEQRRDRHDAEPVRRRRRRARAPRRRAARPCRGGAGARRGTRRARRSAPPTSAAPAARSCSSVEERVEEIEAATQSATAPPSAHACHGQLAGHRHPGADRREPERGAEPGVAEPRDPLQVRVDDEQHDRHRPEPAHERVELEDGDEEDARARARRAPAPAPARARRPAARARRCAGSARRARRRSAGSAPIASVRAPTIATVTQSQSRPAGISPTASSIPTYANGSAKTVCSSFTSDAKRRGRETAVRAHVCLCAVSASVSSPSACASAGRSTANPSRQPPGEPGRLTTSVRPCTPATPRESSACGVFVERVGADRLRDPGRLAVDHRARRLGRDVPRRHAGAAGGEHERRGPGELDDRLGDLPRLVGNDPALDLVAVGGEQLREQVAARVLPRAGDDAVGDRQHGRLHASSFVFSTSVTSAMTISLSIAFAMS